MIDERGEHVCEVCSLVHVLPALAAENNSSSSMGDGRQNEAGPQGTLFGSMEGVLPKFRAKFRNWERKQRGWNRVRDPMYLQVQSTLVEMFGKNTASAVEPMTRASTQQLTGEDAERRMRLCKGEAKKLNLPKTSITRLGGKHHPEKRGGGMQANLHTIALAIATVSSDYFRIPPINEIDLMQRYSITREQLRLAKKSIRQNFEKRLKHGMVRQTDRLSIKQRSRAERREDEFQIALENLMQFIDQTFDGPLWDPITNEFLETFAEIEGESIDGAHANVPVGMLTACVMFQVLKNRGLLDGKRSKIAKAVGLTSQGVGNRLKKLEKADPYGVFKNEVIVKSKNGIVRAASQHHPMDLSLYRGRKRFNSSSKSTTKQSMETKSEPQGDVENDDQSNR
ncbi:hypothetical protein CMO85_00980 [Candidatus Woesearchaeota archaeon]|nr:hypothetical protein [Candidatus Woesearchaeota archaeon]